MSIQRWITYRVKFKKWSLIDWCHLKLRHANGSLVVKRTWTFPIGTRLWLKGRSRFKIISSLYLTDPLQSPNYTSCTDYLRRYHWRVVESHKLCSHPRNIFQSWPFKNLSKASHSRLLYPRFQSEGYLRANDWDQGIGSDVFLFHWNDWSFNLFFWIYYFFSQIFTQNIEIEPRCKNISIHWRRPRGRSQVIGLCISTTNTQSHYSIR